MFATNRDEPSVIKHNLAKEEEAIEENEAFDAVEMTFKVTEPAISFEAPQQKAPETVKEPEPGACCGCR